MKQLHHAVITSIYGTLLQAELEQVQAAFMKELKDVNEKLNTSEKAVAELRQMRCNLSDCAVCLLPVVLRAI